MTAREYKGINKEQLDYDTIYKEFEQDYKDFVIRRHPEVNDEKINHLFRILDNTFDLYFLGVENSKVKKNASIHHCTAQNLNSMGFLYDFDAQFKDDLVRYFYNSLIFMNAVDDNENTNKVLKQFRQIID